MSTNTLFSRSPDEVSLGRFRAVELTEEPKSTSAPFRPASRKGLAGFSGLQVLAFLIGAALCSTGVIGIAIGVMLIAATLYSVYFVPPKIIRGLHVGTCPHCGAEMSATHYHEQVDCPECKGLVAVRDDRFVALANASKS